jgi:tocopherol cyclase
MFLSILNPALYHGRNKKPPFFEGWYYRLINDQQGESIVIIPGIFQHPDPARGLSFIQLIDGKYRESYFLEFPVDLFVSNKRKFELSVNGNTFYTDRIVLDLHHQSLSLAGNLKFKFMTPWPVSVFSPGIMGWYAWIPFMECFHGVLSLNHIIEGTLEINDRKIDFTGGKGYIEKDWGQAFPEAWIWNQSNHFSEDGISLSASIAIIPWIGKAFPGFIIGLLWNEQLYRFATYTGARTSQLRVEAGTVHWIVEDRKYVLEMHSKRGPAINLRAPTPNGMDRRIRESVDSMIEVRLSRKIKTGKTVIFQDIGIHAGFEMEGNIARLLQMVRKN